MRHSFLFFGVLYLFAQTCQGRHINHLHIVVINNLVDPTDKEIQTLTNLTVYPFMKATETSLMTRLGLALNYTIMFSDQPDDMVTLRGLDMDLYSIEYFKNLVKNHTSNCRGASLKTLHKALEITTKNSIIFMAANRRPKGTTLMMEILETMVAKINPVIVIQISQDGSVNWPAVYAELDVGRFLPSIIKKNDEPLIPELEAIADTSKDLIMIMGVEELLAGMYVDRISNMFKTFPKMNTDFKHSYGKRSMVFLYDVPNVTENELDRISTSMYSNFHSKHTLPYNVTYRYYTAYSSYPDTRFTLQKSVNYTVNDFRLMIKTRAKNLQTSSLKALKKTLKFVPMFSQIIYYVKNVPDDGHERLPAIIQLIMDKNVNISIQAYGNLSSKKLPVLYRTILEASYLASSSSYTSTTMIEGMIVLIGLIIAGFMHGP